MDEVLLYDVRRHRKPDGFVKVSCVLENTFDDEDLKDEIIKCLIDTPYAGEAVRMIHEGYQTTPRSALQACIEIANDLLENVEGIEPPPFVENDEETTKDNISAPELALQHSVEKMRRQRARRGRHYRHPVVSMKQYVYQRVYYFYADPSKLDQGLPVRFVV